MRDSVSLPSILGDCSLDQTFGSAFCERVYAAPFELQIRWKAAWLRLAFFLKTRFTLLSLLAKSVLNRIISSRYIHHFFTSSRYDTHPSRKQPECLFILAKT
jgi:hypothetical protein